MPIDIAALSALVKPAPVTKPLINIVAEPGVKPHDWQVLARQPFHERLGMRPAVTGSEDLQRILALPRRPSLDLDDPAVTKPLVLEMTRRLSKPRNLPCKCAELGRPCITTLLPAQAWALAELAATGGLLGIIGVGHGKTGLDILSAMVVPGCKTAVLLIPPGLRQQLYSDYLAWREHFHVPSLILDDGRGYIVPGAPALHVVPFSKFSRAESTALLDSIAPDTIIADEVHNLRHPKTARTGRVLRRFAAAPETRFAGWSGTVTVDSIKNYAHLSAMSLKLLSPLPLDPNVVEDWSLAIDPSDWPAPMGALSALCKPGEHIHQGFHRRLVETPGVVATKAGAVNASLNLIERPVKLPEKIARMLEVLRDPEAEGGWTRPDGEELIDALSVQACARQLASGFFYRWRFPRNEPVELIEEWFRKRKAWHKELREKLKRAREHLDSPLLCIKAAIRHCAGYEGDLPTWHALTWPDWRDIREQVEPEPEAVWVDDFLAIDAAAWAKKHRGIVWYEHAAFGKRVSDLSGCPLHGGGPDAEANIKAEKGDRSIIASIKSHGTGRDGLQYLFSEQLVANPPSSAGVWEQLLGRLHRTGFPGDEVNTAVYRHSVEMAEAVDKAVLKARYVQGTTGNTQKLLSLANCDFALALDQRRRH